MMTRLALAAALSLSLASGAAKAAVTTIDFSGDAIGQPIGDTYASEGLTFSYAIVEQCGLGCPGSNVNGFFAFNPIGSFTTDFAKAQSDISFQTVSFSSTLAQAYNAAGDLVASVSDDETFPVTSQVDQLMGSGITSVVFSAADSSGVAAITDLTFEASAAPEPATWALMIAGVGLTGLAFRQAKRQHGFKVANGV